MIWRDSKHINLIGFRGVGKSSMAFLLSRELNLPVYDTDRLIEKECGSRVGDILHNFGEDYFRDMESGVLRRLCFMKSPIILSTGGGVVIREENRDILKERGYNILLFADEKVIYDRISGDSNRPSLTDKSSLREEIHSLLMERHSYYTDIKDFAVDTSFASKKECVKLIISFLKKM